MAPTKRPARQKQTKKTRKGPLLVLVLIGAASVAGFYFRKEIEAKLRTYDAKARPSSSVSGSHARDHAHPKPHAAEASPATAIKGAFTFFPDAKNQYAWSVKYPDGRVFQLGDEFSSDCNPVLSVAKAPTTIRLEFNEQRSCNSAARKPLRIDAGSMKDTNGDGSPEVIAAIVTGGNVNGHTSSLIALTPKGPHVVRRLD